MANNNTISKEKISELLQANLGFSASVCMEIVNCIFNEIIVLSSTHKTLTLKNLGKSSINHKAARPGFNITTKNPVTIAPRTVLRFNPSRALKNQINSTKSFEDQHE